MAQIKFNPGTSQYRLKPSVTNTVIARTDCRPNTFARALTIGFAVSTAAAYVTQIEEQHTQGQYRPHTAGTISPTYSSPCHSSRPHAAAGAPRRRTAPCALRSVLRILLVALSAVTKQTQKILMHSHQTSTPALHSKSCDSQPTWESAAATARLPAATCTHTHSEAEACAQTSRQKRL